MFLRLLTQIQATLLMALRAYSRAFERRPYITLFVTNGILSAIGDCTAQNIASMNATAVIPDYDTTRTLRFLCFGAAMGPLGGLWNAWLENTFPLRPKGAAAASASKAGSAIPMEKVKVEPRHESPRLGAASSRSTGPNAATPPSAGGAAARDVDVVALAKRVAADQFGMAPISLFIFLTVMSLLEGLDTEQAREKLRNNYMPILLVNWQVWPLFQLLNFRYVPLRFRVPVASIAGIAWTTFLSTRTAAV